MLHPNPFINDFLKRIYDESVWGEPLITHSQHSAYLEFQGVVSRDTLQHPIVWVRAFRFTEKCLTVDILLGDHVESLNPRISGIFTERLTAKQAAKVFLERAHTTINTGSVQRTI